MTIDIGGRSSNLIGQKLSNFTDHAFVVKYQNLILPCASMEGFLQGLKHENPNKQFQVFQLKGFEAKKAGNGVYWQERGSLFWRGNPIDRFSEEYQKLLDCAFIGETGYGLKENPFFKAYLIESGDCEFTHYIGKIEPEKTVLTIDEFITRLYHIRNYYKTIL